MAMTSVQLYSSTVQTRCTGKLVIRYKWEACDDADLVTADELQDLDSQSCTHANICAHADLT